MTKPDYSKLPETLRGGMQRYIEHGIVPGDFLRAVIRRDLVAVLLADDENLARIRVIVRWFHQEAPSDCWGSPDDLRFWLNKHAVYR